MFRDLLRDYCARDFNTDYWNYKLVSLRVISQNCADISYFEQHRLRFTIYDLSCNYGYPSYIQKRIFIYFKWACN